MKSLVVLASGRGSNAAALVRATRVGGALHGVAVVHAVVADRRDAAVLQLARTLGVATLCVPRARCARREAWEAAVETRLRTHGVVPDAWVLAGCLQILSPGFVRRHAGRIVNVHPADTRLHQGLHGYRWAWARRATHTTITVHLVDAGLDTGPVLGRARVDLRGAVSLSRVERRGLRVEHRFYAQVLRHWLLGRGRA